MNPIALAIIVTGFPLSLAGFWLTRAYCRALDKNRDVVINHTITVPFPARHSIDPRARAVIKAAGEAMSSK